MSFSEALAAVSRPAEFDGVEFGTSAWERAVSIVLECEPFSRRGAVCPSPTEVLGRSAGQLQADFPEQVRTAPRASEWRRFAEWWCEAYGEELDPEWERDVSELRAELRKLRGLGPMKIDRIVLYAAGRPWVPLERSLLRVLVRHGWLDTEFDESEPLALFQSAVGPQVEVLVNAVRGLQAVGDRFCGRVPKCEVCPLSRWLPASGPRDLAAGYS